MLDAFQALISFGGVTFLVLWECPLVLLVYGMCRSMNEISEEKVFFLFSVLRGCVLSDFQQKNSKCITGSPERARAEETSMPRIPLL